MVVKRETNVLDNETPVKKEKAKAKEAAAPELDIAIGEDFGVWLRIKFKIVGITPLLQHNAASADLGGDDASLAKKQALSAEPKKVLSRADQAKRACYQNAEGVYYHPADAFRSAIVDAMTGVKIGKRSAKDMFATGLFNVEDQAVLVDPETWKPLKEYVIDTRNGRNPNTGGLIEVNRPRWEKWAIEVEFEYDPNRLTPVWIKQALTLAGQRIGIGAFRPTPPRKNPKRGIGGRFGKFRVLKED